MKKDKKIQAGQLRILFNALDDLLDLLLHLQFEFTTDKEWCDACFTLDAGLTKARAYLLKKGEK